MTRIEAEWLVAWALVVAGIRPTHAVINESPINVGEEGLPFKRCRRCSKRYINLMAGSELCIDCTYREGGTIPEDDPEPRDLVDELTGYEARRLSTGYEMRIHD